VAVVEEMDLEEFLQRLAPSLRIRTLAPVWLFREDVERLYQLLAEARVPTEGEPPVLVEILTERGLLTAWEEVVERRPHAALAFSIPDGGLCVLLLPHEVVILSRYGWSPQLWDTNVLDRAERFLRRRRHYLWFLQRREWQIAGLFLAWISALPAALTSSNGLLGALFEATAILGIIPGGVAFLLATLGWFFPNPQRVSIWAISREAFARRVQWVASLVLAGTFVFVLGAAFARTGWISGVGTLVSLLIGTAAAALLWLAGAWIGDRTEG